MAELRGRKRRPRVIVQICGGLGNQLFCYAAARRLAYVNDAELVLDDVTGFALDHVHRRSFLLPHFKVVGRSASSNERCEPFGRWRRGLRRYLAQRRSFERRRYLVQQGVDFDPRLLEVRVSDSVYIEGYWQSEGYFKDIGGLIREEIRLATPPDEGNRAMSERMHACDSVAVHVRWFNAPAARDQTYNLPREYYRRALDRLEGTHATPSYFVFSDNLSATRELGVFPNARTTYVDVNRRGSSHMDLWLMSQCRHFIIANSTFSWWGAWLATSPGKTVIAPSCKLDGVTAWGFAGLVPPEWIQVGAE